MKKLLFVLAIAIAPIGPVGSLPAMAAANLTELGDMASFHAIVADSLGLVQAGDLGGAAKRITDFETVWDEAAATLRPLSVDKWTSIDHAADAAIEDLRAGTVDATASAQALTTLLAVLDDPAGSSAAPAAAVAFTVSNADGSPLPCEVALETLRNAAASKKPSDQAKYDQLMGKGLDRCNADDDKRADGFFADAYALLG